MARPRARTDKVTFDLEPDLEPDLGPYRVPDASDQGPEPDRFSGAGSPGSSQRAWPDGDPTPGWARGPVDAAAHLLAALRSWPRRRRAAVAGGLAVLLAGGVAAAVAVDGARDRALADRLATAPGGVVGLDDAPAERWRVALADPWPVAVVDGSLVVAADHRGGLTLHGLDPDDGAQRWATDLDEAWTCGGANGPRTVPQADVGIVEEIVCLGGGTPDVIVVGAGGRIVAERPVAATGEDELVMPAPGSAVLRIGRFGTPSPEPRFDAEALLDTLVTRPARVRLEDARTGALRWEATLSPASLGAGARVGRLQACLAATGVGETQRIDPDQGWSTAVDARRLWVSGCGVDAAFDLRTGSVITTRDPFDPAVQSWVPSVVTLDADADADADADGDGGADGDAVAGGDGGADGDAVAGGDAVADSDGDGDGYGYAIALPADGLPEHAFGATRIRADDGTVVGDLSGSVMLPLATDGTTSRALFVVGPRGLTAYDRSGLAERWTRDPAHHAQVLLATERTVVVASGSDVVAVEPRSGATLWTNPLWQHDPNTAAEAGPGSVVDAFTDGDRLVLVEQLGLAGDGVADTELVALDVGTGASLWTWRAPLAPRAIGGRLYTFDVDAVTALG